MASGGHQPEPFSMVDFDGKQDELVRKLSEISTSMRQCAEIVDSFSQIVRHLSLRPTSFEGYRQTSTTGPSKVSSYPRPERPDATTSTSHPEGTGTAPPTQGTEAYRRGSTSHVGGSMFPPAVPTYHPPGLPLGRPSSSSSMHAMPGPPSYPLQRRSSATSGPGPAASNEPVGSGRMSESEMTALERASSDRREKRKRPLRGDGSGSGAESDEDAAMKSSPRLGTTEGMSEADELPRRPRHAAYPSESSEAKYSSRGEGARVEDRPTEQGPSIVVFASGAVSRQRASQPRSQAQTSTRARKEKKPRDPNAPKQPAPAYIVYQNEIRESMRARFPGHSPTELVKEIAATWKTLSNSERQRYKDQANIEKDRWVAELAAYQATLSTPEEAQTAKSSEGSFLATAAVSDSPPASSPTQSPRMSDVEAESHDVRRVSSQDTPPTYGYDYQGPLRASSSFPGAGGVTSTTAGTSSPRPGAESYPRMERPRSRLAASAFGSFSHVAPLPTPSALPGRAHFAGSHMDSRGPSTRLPSFDSLRLGRPLHKPRDPSPGPPSERVEEEEPAPKRQRTRGNSSNEEGDGGGGYSHPAREERKSE